MTTLTRPSPGFMSGVLLAMLVAVSPVYASLALEGQKLESSDVVIDDSGGGEDGFYARSFAQSVSGTTAAVLNRNDETAYVFVYNGTTWEERAKLKPLGADFSSSITISGDLIVIGVSGSTGEQAGKAFVFERSGTTWSEQSQLELPALDRGQYESFGWSVAVSGDTVIAGAAEAAYVYTRSGSNWSEPTKLHGVRSSAISGDTIIARKVGATSVFIRSGNTWIKQADLPVGDSIAISGDTIVVGLTKWADDDSMSGDGMVHIYTRSGATWSEQDT